MFGSKRRVAAVNARVEELERRVARLSAQVAQAAPLLADEARLTELALRAEGALRALGNRAEPQGVGRPRIKARLDTVYQAEVHGYVSVHFVGGRTADVRLLVGTEKPPTQCVGRVATGGGINSYAGMVVRPGEYWTAESNRKTERPGFAVHFMPLF